MRPSHVTKEAVGRVIQTMQENLGEQLTLDELARTAMFSKFHFTRMFQRVTGISPGRFLAAMRLREAKQLLTSTSLSVAEITHRVGYSSVGTFSSRFSSCVGVSPQTYRRMGGITPPIVEGHQAVPDKPSETVHGNVSGPDHDGTGPIFVGLFPAPVCQGQPGNSVLIPGPGPYTLEKAPPGRWFVLAYCGGHSREPAQPSSEAGVAELLASHGPITIRPGAVVRADLRLRPMDTFDPPVLLALRIER